MVCADCEFFDISGRTARCRRFPPQQISGPDGDECWRFPRVGENDRCGEFQQKLTRDTETFND